MVNHRIILAFLTGTVVLLILLRVQGSSLVNEQAPAGIVSFELAGSRTKAEAISSAWESEGRTKTALGNIRLDYLFIPFYSLFLYMSCGTLATGSSSRSRRPGVWIAFGSLLAGMLDVFENLVMSAQIKGGISNACRLHLHPRPRNPTPHLPLRKIREPCLNIRDREGL
jgi:hypothetical protein